MIVLNFKHENTIKLKQEFNVSDRDILLIRELLNNLKPVKLTDYESITSLLLDKLKTFYTSSEIINLLKVGKSSYYEFSKAFVVNKTYKQLFKLYLLIKVLGYGKELENE